MITGHLMNQFRFTGPSATVDTACSSSVSAMEMAVTDLMTGRCQFAMVTGQIIIFFLNCYPSPNDMGHLGRDRIFDKNRLETKLHGSSTFLFVQNVVFLSICM